MIPEPVCTIFMFINSASGGGVGSKLIKQEVSKVEFLIAIESDREQTTAKSAVHVYFFNMRTSREAGFSLLKATVDMQRRVIAVVCGGDGTVIWVVKEISRFMIDASRVPLTVIPLGTGNDFSQYLGWGKNKTVLTQNSYESLKKLIRKWMTAKEQPFDIWDIKAEVFPKGKFEKVNSTTLQNQALPGVTYEATFSNYFSFGLDGKIGYSFDRHRTASRSGNLIMYGTLGLIKNATHTKTLPELLESFENIEDNLQIEQESILKESQCLPVHTHIKEPNQAIQSAAKIERFSLNESNPKRIILQKKYLNLLVLNIDSFMGGVKGIWNKADNPYQVQVKTQSSCDGKIQFVSFNTGVGMALERIFGGFAYKIIQGSGPYVLRFKEYPQNEKHRTYLQIDGEFVRFTHPQSLVIKKSSLTPNGQIKVLRNVAN